MSRCKIRLLDSSDIHYTGQEINGVFECYFTEAIRVRDIKLILECKENHKWSLEENIVYKSEEILFHPSHGYRTIHKGRNIFKFEVTIPRNLPSSFESPYGYVKYTLTGIVDQLIWSDMKDKIVLHVLAKIDITLLPSQYLRRKKLDYDLAVYVCCYRVGLLNVTIHLPRLAFVPGEIIFIMVTVKNMSARKIRKVVLTLIKTVSYIVDENSVKEKSEVVLKISRPGVESDHTVTHEIDLEIPENLQVTNFSSCQLMRNDYVVRVACQFTEIKEEAVEFHPKIGHVYYRMSSEIDRSLHILPNDQPIVSLEVADAFQGLADREKLYAHYISQASWHGSLITLLQTSPESGPIFVLLHKIFSVETPKEFAAEALEQGFTEDEIKALFVYACGVFCNAGNYKGFGDTKFIPNISAERLEKLLHVSQIWHNVQSIWYKYKAAIYDLSPGNTCLGFPPTGCTTYLSKNCNVEDNKRVQEWLKNQNLELNNTRLFKTVSSDGNVDYEIRLASKEIGKVQEETSGKYTYRLVKGDYSPIIAKVAEHLGKAVYYTANENQTEMLNSYIRSFVTGSLNDHKTGSRFWIKDKAPAVESYIGFIETYRDPAGVRGEFEGFVAIVNRQMSEKFTSLVEHAEDFLPLLPWAKGFEKDKFLRPDFTSLDVLTFASSGIPAGINIPNYDDIRQSEGFKNVSLGNVIPASYQMAVTPFLNSSDGALMEKWRIAAFELQVGLHELLGHGSGKLLRRAANGTHNYPKELLDPLTGRTPATCYEAGDTYDSVFGSLGSSYEECRAEAVGLYLSLEPTILKIFGHTGQQAEDVLYVNWLSLVWNGVGKALETWDAQRGWLQAHAQARFVLARVLIQAGVASVSQPVEGDLLVSLDRSALRGAGRNAIGHFLLQLQVYKATGNVQAAQALYHQYSEVTEPWLSWRAIVLANKQPRKMFVQSNTMLDQSAVKLKTYEPTLEGLIDSWVERFPLREPLYEALMHLSAADEKSF